MHIIVAITGASGVSYGIKLIQVLLARGDDVSCIISPSGIVVIKEELGLDLGGAPHEIQKKLINLVGGRGILRYIPSGHMVSFISSGSSLVRQMIICPCSMGTLGRIAGGVSGNLIERAADCMMKEQRSLILVPRETPLNPIHLENMLKLSKIGVSIVAAMPGFYGKPETVDDIIDFVVGKVLDTAGIENKLYKRWLGDDSSCDTLYNRD